MVLSLAVKASIHRPLETLAWAPMQRFAHIILAVAIILFFVSAQATITQPKTSSINRIPFTVMFSNGEIPASVPATNKTVGDALKALGISTENSIVTPALETSLIPNLFISIISVREVTLTDGNKKSATLLSSAQTVGDALMSAGISLNKFDILSPSPETALAEGAKIEITRISITERTETVSIPHETRYLDDSSVVWGKEFLLSAGKDGLADETVLVKTINGEVVSKNILTREVLEPPTTEERRRGSKMEIDFAYEGGGSWYAYRDCNCAASTKYPKGTWLRVTSLLNGKRVIVKTNDWGPDPAVHPDRIIDLDAVAFKQLAPLWKGVIPVRVEHIVTEND